MSEQFCDVGRGVTLCFETFGEPSDPPAVLIMGQALQMVAWHDDLCRALASRGLYVVRFDNRDSGRSTHMTAPVPNVGQLLARYLLRSRRAPYTLTDMADDTAGLLRELGLAPAHMIGASMGGMIAQTLAVQRPRMVRSLVSMMSSTGTLRAGQPSLRVLYTMFLRHAPAEREAFVDHAERVFAVVGAPGQSRDLDDIRAIAAASYDRGHDPAGSVRQLAAIIAAGDRTAQLRAITAPTLVIHGSADRLVSPSGGRATARAIPGARLMSVEGMGHDMPRALWPQLLDAIAEHAKAADARADHRSAPQPKPRARVRPTA